MSAWTEITTYCAKLIAPSVTGISQLTNVFIRGASSSNTNAGTLYVNLTNSGSTRTVDLFKDSIKTLLVGRATRVGDGWAYVVQQNNSGLGGTMTITYTGDDTTGNTFFFNFLERIFVMDSDSVLKPYKNDLIIFNKNVDTTCYVCHINLTDNKFVWINGGLDIGYGGAPFPDSGSQGSTTPYGYDLIYTFCRITNTDGTLNSSVNRISGVLQYESASNAYTSSSSLPTNLAKDYGEYWTANPISGANPLTLVMSKGGTLAESLFGDQAAHHYTHIGVYRCLDRGINGIDPISGAGNDNTIFVWDSDIDITSPTASLTKTDADLRATLEAGTILETRFWTNIATGEVGEVSDNFIFSATRGLNKIDYGQIENPVYIGFHFPAQFLQLNDGIQDMRKVGDLVIPLCASKTYTISPKIFSNISSNGAVNILRSLTTASETIGITDYGSIADLDQTSFIAHCSDHTFRVFDSVSWQQDDLASSKIGSVLKGIINGSVGVYFNRAYYFWYRTSASSNTAYCLRLGFGKDAGSGWSKVSGDSWPLPHTNIGAYVIFDTNNVQRCVVLDAADAKFYWIETFTGYSGSNLTKVYLDKVASNGSGGTNVQPKFRIKDLQGSLENYSCILQESYVATRPTTGSYLSGFQLNVNAYTNGGSTVVGSISNAPYNGDIQTFREVEGNSIQLEYIFLASGLFVTSASGTYYSLDKKNVTRDITTTDDYSYQINLNSNLNHWFTRTNPIYMDLATNTNGAVTGTLTTTTGPDTKTTSAMSFASSTYITKTAAYSYASDFALSFWIQSAVTATDIFRIAGSTPFYIQFASNTSITISALGNITISTIASGWHHFLVSRTGSTFTVYQNGVSKGTVSGSATYGGGNLVIGGSISGTAIADIRIFSSNLSLATDAYYYADVVSATSFGSLVMPIF